MTNNGLVTIKNVRGYIGENRVAFLNLEDVARGLGYERVENRNNKEYKSIRWATIEKYLKEFGFANKLAKDDFIPENVFYKLCMKANNEVARKFQDLVCDEILPSIRKNGVYATDDFITKALDNPDFAIKLLTELKEERAKVKRLETENEVHRQIIEEFKPVKEYLDVILASDDTLCITQIAADYGLSGVELNKILNKEGVIRKINGQWLLYKEHMNKGYTQSHTYNISTIIGERTAITTRWTQKGRLKIHEILTGLGIKANMDKEKELS